MFPSPWSPFCLQRSLPYPPNPYSLPNIQSCLLWELLPLRKQLRHWADVRVFSPIGRSQGEGGPRTTLQSLLLKLVSPLLLWPVHPDLPRTPSVSLPFPPSAMSVSLNMGLPISLTPFFEKHSFQAPLPSFPYNPSSHEELLPPKGTEVKDDQDSAETQPLGRLHTARNRSEEPDVTGALAAYYSHRNPLSQNYSLHFLNMVGGHTK